MQPPDWLDAHGKKVWSDNFIHLSNDVKKVPLFLSDFARYCDLDSAIHRLTLEVRGNETYQYKTRIIKNPTVGVLSDLKKEHRAISDRFGLTPYSQVRLSKKTKDSGKVEEIELD